MSTRCQIGFYESKDQKNSEFEALIYKHSDGYPDGVLPTLVPMCQVFEERRGMTDTEYLAAWVLASFISFHIKQGRKLSKELRFIKNRDGIDCLGFGICKGFHGDIEYFYKVSPNLIQVYEVGEGLPDEWSNIVQEIPIIFLKTDTKKVEMK